MTLRKHVSYLRLMKRFTIRVYGIWIDEDKQILLSDERLGSKEFTKFPGGGLEFGEGISDCLQREWQEELGTDIEMLNHIYTTEFFQASAFHPNTQVISVYYQVKPASTLNLPLQDHPFSFQSDDLNEILFRKIPLENLVPEMLSFPIDQHVARLLRAMQ